MISVLTTEVKNFRAFGWIQDPSDFKSLCNVVAVFDENSKMHSVLTNIKIPQLVDESDGRNALLTQLHQRPLKLGYKELIGTAFIPRKNSRCNGIIQAAVKGQRRPFIGDWPANNYVRWAHAFGFIKYDYTDDSFSITETGRKLTAVASETKLISSEEKEILIDAILSYPPAIRILYLLSANENTHLTKFEIGKQLGFVGEGGFTSLPQELLIADLSQVKDSKKQSDMRANWEGSSDKYARTISGWLCNLNLVQRQSKIVTVKRGNQVYTESIGQSYMITAAGLQALNRSKGNSKHKRIPKNVYYELFAPCGKDREILRTRRSFILKCISESKCSITVEDIILFLESKNLHESYSTIIDDIHGLQNIGISIAESNGQVSFHDLITDFTIPLINNIAPSPFTEVKDIIRERLSALSHEYLSLLDLAYDNSQNRVFEMKTMELFTNECGFIGRHLGGSRKPDGIMYTESLSNNYGVIVDTKAYSRGYNLPISQADEMERYVRENQKRDVEMNPNKWWEYFSGNENHFYFLFVAGNFIGGFQSQLERVSKSTSTLGAALPVAEMLLCANAILQGALTLDVLEQNMFTNKQYNYPSNTNLHMQI